MRAVIIALVWLLGAGEALAVTLAFTLTLDALIGNDRDD